MTAATISRPDVQFAEPQSFVPPGDRTMRLAHLDPRPLYPDRAPVASPWRSPTFYLTCALVMPVAAVVAPLRYVLGAR